MSSTRRMFSRLAASAPQHGGLMIETAVSILVFSIVGTIVLSGVSIGAGASTKIEVQSTLDNLARNEIEYVLGQAYQDPTDPPSSCPIDPGLPLPSGYSLSCEVGEYVPGDLNVANITVTASTNEGHSLTLQTVRAK